jgi:hypothetical protein
MFERRVLGAVTLAKILRGPVPLIDLDPEDMAALLRPIAADRRIRARRPLLRPPELPAGGETDALMARLGKRPMPHGHATSWLDLTPDAAALRAGLDGKWRNQLVRAEGAKLRVQSARGGRLLDLLIENHESFRRARTHHGPSGPEAAALIAGLHRKEDALVLTAFAGSTPVAGILIVVDGRAATYHIAWTGPEGRRAHAHNLLLWQAVLALKERGATALELGGLDAKAPGVARFMMGLGGGMVEMARCICSGGQDAKQASMNRATIASTTAPLTWRLTPSSAPNMGKSAWSDSHLTISKAGQ